MYQLTLTLIELCLSEIYETNTLAKRTFRQNICFEIALVSLQRFTETKASQISTILNQLATLCVLV